ncbi:MAG: hypothetical protein JST90_04825 [Bacteroidetes bacterium]|nr:hypothetical protein [Bacteroidota bacterium]
MTTQPEVENQFTPEAEKSINALMQLMDRVRRAARKDDKGDLQAALLLSADDIAALEQDVVWLFAEADISYALTESGIPVGNSFAGETMRLFKASILPYVLHERDLRVVIKKIFHHKKDGDLYSALMEAYGNDWVCANAARLLPDSNIIQTYLENAAKVISYRIAAIGMEEEILIRAGRDETLITPFMEQNKEVNELLVSIEKADRDKVAEDYGQAMVMLKQCTSNIRSMDKAAAQNGTSLKQTFLLRKSEKLVERLSRILALIQEMEAGQKVTGFCTLITEIIQTELRPRKLREFVNDNIQMIAYRITEHKRMTGEHYITSGRREYRDMFLSAAGGGFIVSFMVIIKLFLHHAHLPPLWEGIGYSLNYAIGFVVVQLLGFTIATKQPAMTAAYIAGSLDGAEGKRDYVRFAAVIAAVMRSQIVSFAGNLLVVFPFALLWIYLIGLSGGDHFIAGHVAEKMLADISPIRSLSALYAAFAGFYLFMAGLISGFGDNKVIVSRIGLRLQHHPWLIRHMRADRLARLSHYLDHNLGGLMGNIAVGFMLGMTAFAGHITGIPLDIRHVTFSMGNFALGIYGQHYHVAMQMLLSCLGGLAVIGFVNFIVSFWLALFVAMRSRGLYFRNYPDLIRSVWKYFRKHPSEFFWPKREEKTVELVEAEVL